MKKMMLLQLIFTVGLMLIGCSRESQPTQTSNAPVANVDYSLMDLADTYTSLEQLTADSSLIAEVVLTGEFEGITYEGADFVLSEAMIKDVVKGDQSYEDQKINIFEVKAFNINLTRKSDRFLLFLDKYEGPVTEGDAYVITGVYQGKFGIDDNNNIVYDAGDYNGEVTFQSAIEHTSIDEFKKVVKK
jgi:hypothetical protein